MMRRTKIMVFGTFDVLHKGHLSFFRQARRLARSPFLIVSIARDINAAKIKGAKPQHNEKVRLMRIKRHPLVNKAVLGGKYDFLPHILKEKPDIIALGYDQKAYTQDLSKLFKKRGLQVKVFRLKSFNPQKYKSSILKGNMVK